MTSHFFDHPLAHLHYYRFGRGEKVMLCFHGYGMHGRQFRMLESQLGDQYCFYGFDLFFHEQTVLKDMSPAHLKKGLSKDAFCALIQNFCEAEGIRNFSVIAYSLGTNYAMVLAESGRFSIERMALLAPAFLGIPPVFHLLGHQPILNSLFRQLCRSKYALHWLLAIAKNLKMTDEDNQQILKKEMATRELRMAFYYSVTYLRFLRPDLETLKKELNTREIPVFFFFGKKDPLFPPSIGGDFLLSLVRVRTQLLEEGHDMVNEKLAGYLKEIGYDH